MTTLKHKEGQFCLLYQNFCQHHGHALHPGSTCKWNLKDAVGRRTAKEHAQRRVAEGKARNERSYKAALAGAGVVRPA